MAFKSDKNVTQLETVSYFSSHVWDCDVYGQS